MYIIVLRFNSIIYMDLYNCKFVNELYDIFLGETLMQIWCVHWVIFVLK